MSEPAEARPAPAGVPVQALAAAGLVVTAAFFAARLLGWLRLVVISALFGAEADLDAYLAAFRIPDAIYQLAAAGALSSALVPVVAGLLANGEDAHAWRVVSTVINGMLLVLLALAVVVAIAAPVIMLAITPGFDVVQMELTVRLTRVMLLSPILLALGAVASSVLNAAGRFGAAAVAPLLYNVAILLAAVFLSPIMGVESLAVGVVIGSLLHVAVQLPVLLGKTGFSYDFRLDLDDPVARQTALLMAPRALGLAASQITFIVNTSLASGLQTGSIVAYNIAFTILQIPLGVIGVPLGIVLLPAMSRAVATGAVREFGSLVVRSLRLLLYVMLFLTALMIVLRRQIATLLFDYGRIGPEAIDATANTLLFFLFGLAAHAMIVVLARAFYAGKDTRTPVLAALLSVAVNVVVSVLTVGSLGLSGLALGIAAGAWVEAALLTTLLWQRTKAIRIDVLGRAASEFALGAALAGLAALVVIRLTDGLVGTEPGKIALALQSGLAASVGGSLYLAYGWFLRIPELRTLLELTRSTLRGGPRPT
ncbi:MAG TPA: murein biosynthesis integral membrane protein MurJ [Candidatus Limnocylindrales bacterium]|nr:murein biosynthesis integral membrane protein MurJ [Candidatus Limnocylindrales bacterium]